MLVKFFLEIVSVQFRFVYSIKLIWTEKLSQLDIQFMMIKTPGNFVYLTSACSDGASLSDLLPNLHNWKVSLMNRKLGVFSRREEWSAFCWECHWGCLLDNLLAPDNININFLNVEYMGNECIPPTFNVDESCHLCFQSKLSQGKFSFTID